MNTLDLNDKGNNLEVLAQVTVDKMKSCLNTVADMLLSAEELNLLEPAALTAMVSKLNHAPTSNDTKFLVFYYRMKLIAIRDVFYEYVPLETQASPWGEQFIGLIIHLGIPASAAYYDLVNRSATVGR